MKQKQHNQTPPKGSLKASFESKGITWTCVSVDVPNNEFTFKGSNGQEVVRKWEELGSVKI